MSRETDALDATLTAHNEALGLDPSEDTSTAVWHLFVTLLKTTDLDLNAVLDDARDFIRSEMPQRASA